MEIETNDILLTDEIIEICNEAINKEKLDEINRKIQNLTIHNDNEKIEDNIYWFDFLLSECRKIEKMIEDYYCEENCYDTYDLRNKALELKLVSLPVDNVCVGQNT